MYNILRMIKNILGVDFKYENDKMYRKLKTKWNSLNDNKPRPTGYIQININKKYYHLHRLIYKYFNEDWDISDISSNNQIDHYDINKSNNKIENLRVVNHSVNQGNRNKFKNCSSKYIGVSWINKNNKWRAQIQIEGKAKYLGLFDNEEEASEAYQKKYEELMKL